MNKGLIAFLLVFCLTAGKAQTSLENLFGQKDSVLNLYHNHTDSITINSWINVMQSNNFLEQITYIDSLIIQELSLIDQDSLIKDFNQQISTYDTLIYNRDIEISRIKHDNEFYKRMYYMLLIIGLLFLVIIVVLLFLTGRLNRLSREKERQLKSYHTDLFSAKAEIERSRKTENQMASEINKLKKHIAEHNEETDDTELVREEKLLLENQIIEIRKAYEIESAKRLELENELLEKDNQKEDSSDIVDQDEVKQLNVKYEQLKAEYDDVLLKLESLNKSETDLQETLKQQTEARVVAEKRHAELVEKLKNLSADL